MMEPPILYTENIYKFLDFEKKIYDLAPRLRSDSGHALWPYIRQTVGGSIRTPMYDAPQHGAKVTQAQHNLSPAFYHALAKLPKGLCLIMTTPELHVDKVRGKLYDPYLDPVLEEAECAGLPAIKISFTSTIVDSLHSLVCLPRTTEYRNIPASRLPAIAFWDEYVALSKECGVTPRPIESVWQMWHDMQAYAALYSNVLRVMQPNLVILECWYYRNNAGMALSCRRQGIPCVDYQHGMHVRGSHIGYEFGYMPPEGLEYMPEWFFTWGDAFTDHLRVQLAEQSFHKAVTTGKPNYIAWSKGRLPDDPETLHDFLQKIKGKIPICVPLPLYCSEENFASLREAIAQAPSDWLWLVRQHPLTPCPQGTELLHLFPQKTETQAANKLCLHTLLAHCRHIVFAESSTCLEAIYLHGMRGTSFTRRGQMLLGNYFDDGTVTFAQNSADILRSVHHGVAEFPSGRISTHQMTKETYILQIMLKKLAQKGTSPSRQH